MKMKRPFSLRRVGKEWNRENILRFLGYILAAFVINLALECLSRRSLGDGLHYMVTRPWQFFYDSLIILFTLSLSLLFLSALEVPAQPQAAAPGLSRGQVSLARKTADYLLANTESKVTVQELSRHFGASAAQIQASFRGVYGRSPAAWLRLQKMHGAAKLLRSTDRTVLDIAGQFGYDNASKFARAFRDVIGVSPNEYRSGLDQDSCAP